MSDGDDLSPHVVVESVDTVGVDETVPDPAASVDHLLRLPHHLGGHLTDIIHTVTQYWFNMDRAYLKKFICLKDISS